VSSHAIYVEYFEFDIGINIFTSPWREGDVD